MARVSKLKRSVAYDNSSFNPTKRTVSLAASSTTPYLRSFGWEILGHEVDNIDFSRLNAPAPLLREHDTDHVLGVLESYSLDSDGVLRAEVRFDETANAMEAMRQVANGTLGQTSIGYMPVSMRQIGEKDGVPVFEVNKWIPHEISLVTIAADVIGAGIGRSVADQSNEKDAGLMELVTRAMATYAMEKAKPVVTSILTKSLVKTEPEIVAEKAAETVATQDTAEEGETISAQAESTNPELERVTALESLGRAYDAEALAAECITSGATPDVFKSKLDDFKRGLSAAIHTKTKTKGKEEMSKFNQLVRAAAAGEKAPEAVRTQNDTLRREYAAIAGKTNELAVLAPATDFLSRAYSVGVANEGGSTTQTDFDPSQIIRHLHNADVVSLLGVPTPTLYAATEIPRQTVLPGAVAWGYGEGTVAAEVKNNRFDRLKVQPRRMTACASLTTDILNDSRIDIGTLIQDDLQDQINLAKQVVLLGAGDVNNDEVPIGLDGSGITAYTGATYANAREHILRMAATISKQNSNKPRSFYKLLMNESTKTSFELVKRDAGSNVFLCENDKIENMQVVVSNSIADNVVYIGDWTQVWMPNFFTASVYTDPNYKAGIRDFVFEFWFDVGVKRPKFFAKATFA